MPGVDVVTCLQVLDPARLSQSGRIDLLVAIERQVHWLQARQMRVLAALDADAPALLVEHVSVEPSGRLVDFNGRLVDHPVIQDLWSGEVVGHDSGVAAADDEAVMSSTPVAVRGVSSPESGFDLRTGHDEPGEWIIEEVACALAISSRTAATRVHMAVELVRRLPATLTAVEIGQPATYNAQLIAETTAALLDEQAQQLEAVVLPTAGRLTPTKLRRALARARLRIDPDQVDVDHRTAVEDRRVIVTPRPDGLAELWALLPADDAQLIYAALTQLAESGLPTGPGPASIAGELLDDSRTLTQRRVDALTELCNYSLHHPITIGPAAAADAGNRTGSARVRRSRNRRRPVIQVTVALSTLLGIDDDPAELTGHGPIPATLARQIAGDQSGTWRRLLTDPAGHLADYGTTRYRPPTNLADAITAQYPTCIFPTCSRSARQCQLDHRTRATDAGPTNFHNLGSLCLRHHQAKDTHGWTLRREPDRSHTWTSPTGHRYTTQPTPLASKTATADQRLPNSYANAAAAKKGDWADNVNRTTSQGDPADNLNRSTDADQGRLNAMNPPKRSG